MEPTSQDENSSGEVAESSGRLELARDDVQRWIRGREEGVLFTPTRPPVSIVRCHDLLERYYGWKRLVPYSPRYPYVDLLQYKEYLEDYFTRNQTSKPDALLGPLKSLPCIAQDSNLHALAKLCVVIENNLMKDHFGKLSHEEIRLSLQIRDNARRLIRSEAGSCIALASLMCVTLEGEFLYRCLKYKNDSSRWGPMSYRIRRSASNFMFREGSEYAAAAGAMLGIAEENMCILKGTKTLVESINCDHIRTCTVIALIEIEKEFARKTSGNADGNDTPAIDISDKAIGGMV